MLPKRVVSIAYEFELLVHPVLCPSLTVESFHKWKHETLSGLGLAGLQYSQLLVSQSSARAGHARFNGNLKFSNREHVLPRVNARLNLSYEYVA